MKEFVASLSNKTPDKFTDVDTAVQIIQAGNSPPAEQIICQDPFITHNYSSTARIKELAEGSSANNWLASHSQTEQKR